jgi:hypothetical protein
MLYAGENISAENVSAFIEDYDEERLERKEIKDEEEEGEEEEDARQ